VSIAVPPPRPPETQKDLAQRVAELEALIEEARRRARRRRAAYAALVIAAVAACGAAYFDVGGSSGVPLTGSVAEGSPRVPLAHASVGRWSSLHGPDGGAVFAFALDPANPRIAYAGGWGNIFKSTNGGESWTDITSEPWDRVTALAIDPARTSTIYAGTDIGIARSDDGGRHWHMVNTGLLEGKMLHRYGEGFVSSLLVDAQHPATVFARTDFGLFRTVDGGGRWRLVAPRPRRTFCGKFGCRLGAPTAYDLAVAIDPAHARTMYAEWQTNWTGKPTTQPYKTALFKSVDGGTSWRQVGASRERSPFSALVYQPSSGTLFGTSGGSAVGVFASVDGGVTWHRAGLQQERVEDLRVDPGDPNALYATVWSGQIVVTRDEGLTWSPAPGVINWGFATTDPKDPSIVYAAGDGLERSVDGGHTWREVDNGLVSTFVDALVLAPDTPKTLYSAAGDVFKSTDGGRSWQSSGVLAKKNVGRLAIAGSAIYAGTTGSGIFRSTDAGGSWQQVVPGKDGEVVAAIAAAPGTPSTVYAGFTTYTGLQGARVYQSVDGGATWAPRPGLHKVQSLAVDPRFADTVFAGTDHGIYRSTNGGTTWTWVGGTHTRYDKFHLTDPDTVQTIAIDARNPRIVYAGILTRGILESTDGGETWSPANTGLTDPRVRVIAIDPHDSQRLYASTFGGGVFTSTDGAHTWHHLNAGLFAMGVGAFAVDPTGRRVFAGTDGEGVVSLTTAN